MGNLTQKINFETDIVGVETLFGDTYVLTRYGVYRVELGGARSLVHRHTGTDSPSAFGRFAGRLFIGTDGAPARIISLKANLLGGFDATVEFTYPDLGVDDWYVTGFGVRAGVLLVNAILESGDLPNTANLIVQHRRKYDGVWATEHQAFTNTAEYERRFGVKVFATNTAMFAAAIINETNGRIRAHTIGNAGSHFTWIRQDGMQNPQVAVSAVLDGFPFTFEDVDGQGQFGVVPSIIGTGYTLGFSDAHFHQLSDSALAGYASATIVKARARLGSDFDGMFVFGLELDMDDDTTEGMLVGVKPSGEWKILTVPKVLSASDAPKYLPWGEVYLRGTYSERRLAVFDYDEPTALRFFENTAARTPKTHWGYFNE